VSAIRLPPKLKAQIDEWAARQDDKPPRSVAIRRMIEMVLRIDAQVEANRAAVPKRRKEK
jgi:hypothetical protein